MCRNGIKNDLEIIIDNIQLLKHIFDVFFFSQKMTFTEKLKIFVFSRFVALH